MKRCPWFTLSLLILFALLSHAHADIKLNGLFTDGAVLQQNHEIPVWGTGREGERVVVKLASHESSTTVKNGHWMLKLKPLKAGGPFTLTVIGDNTITLTNVLIGEVWLCS